VIRFLNLKKLESLQTQDRAIRVGNSLKKTGNTTIILPIYIFFSTSIFVVKNKHLFYTNSQTCSIHTRYTTNLHPPTAHLSKFQKEVYCSAIKIFNNLPHEIKDSANKVIPFQKTLRSFLLTQSFYNSDGYFNYKRHYLEQ
jgi:hypothetical protein